MRNILRAVSALIISFAMAVSAFALDINAVEKNISANYQEQIYNLDNGLEAVNCHTVIQTPKGYIWVGTYMGIYCYDGSVFRLMSEWNEITNVRAMFCDSKDRIWIGTNDNGVFLYDGGKISVNYNKSSGLTSNSVRSFCELSDGTIYIGTTHDLFAVSPSGDVRIVCEGDKRINYVTSMCSSDDGVVSGVTNDGMLFFINSDDTLIAAYESNMSGTEQYSCVTYCDDGSFLAGTTGSEIYRYVLSTSGVYSQKCYDFNEISGIYLIETDETGGWWVCADNGILRFTSSSYYERLNLDSFKSNITDVMRDYQGNYWFSSSSQGVLKLSESFFSDINKQYDLNEEVVNAVELFDEYIYIGSDNGLDIVNKFTGKTVKNKFTEMLVGTKVKHIYTDSHKRIWISTYSMKGLFCYDPHNDIYEQYNEKTKGTLGSKFSFVTELTNGMILAASTSGLTYIYDGKVIHTIDADHGLAIPQILCAVERKDGTLLAGSDGDGIYIIEGGRIYYRVGENYGLTSLSVMKIVPYKDIYFLVTGNNIYTMDSEDNVKLIDSFPYANNFGIIADENNNKVWVLSSAGIYVLDGDRMAANDCGDYFLINTSKGLNSALTANSWNCTDDGSNLYLCCIDGVKKINMNNYTGKETGVRIAFNGVMLPNDVVIRAVPNGVNSGTLTLPVDADSVEFRPAVLNYTLQDPLLYVCCEGLEESGVYVRQSELSGFRFTNIPHGEYRFVMQLIDENTNLPKDELVYTIIKEAQFFETPIFKVYLFIIGVAGIIFITWIATKIGSLSVIKRQYEEIREAKEEADKANNAKSMFLANVSHEIRTPINTILGMNEMVLRENTNANIEKYALNIKNSGPLLLSIINSILDISKIESGQMKILPAEYDVRNVISDVTAMSKLKAAEKKLRFESEISEDIPKILYGDEMRIKQIITNLLSNAFKYTEKGKVKLSMRSEKLDDGNILLCVSVEDTGIGIKEEDMDRLFMKFERLEERRNRNIEGTGLGLSIANSLLHLMDSQLHVISEYGKGSIFGFSVKQKPVSEDTVGSLYRTNDMSVKSRYVYKPSFTAPDAKILIIDDNNLNLEVAKGLLKKTSVGIRTAFSGKECLEIIKNERYDMIFLDHMMPEMDGIEILKHIRSDENMCRDVPVVIFTANAVAGSKNMYLEEGFDDYVSKPVDGEELERVLMKHLPKELVHEYNENGGCEEDVSDIPEITGVDSRIGLHYNGGNVAEYIKMLKIYASGGNESIAKMEYAFESEDWSSYEIEVHSLKSTSLGIGAKELSEAAKQLENAASENNAGYIKQNHKAVISMYGCIVNEVNEYLSVDKNDDTGEISELEEISIGDYVKILERIRNDVMNFDFEISESQLNELRGKKCDGNDVKMTVCKLIGYFEEYEWQKAEDYLNGLIDKLKRSDV